MALPIIQGFDVQAPESIDSKTIKINIQERDNIPIPVRYLGLTVYCIEEQKSYRLQVGITNFHWVEQKTDGFSTTDFIYSSSGEVDAFKPVSLNRLGKIDPSMLSSGDLSLYYQLDGTVPLTGNMDAGGFRLTNVSAAKYPNDVVVLSQLDGYMSKSDTANDSQLLNGQSHGFYLNCSNFTDELPAECLPKKIASDTSGKADYSTYADEWKEGRELSLTGSVKGKVNIKGDVDMSLFTVVTNDSHKHTSSTVNLGFKIQKINIGGWNIVTEISKSIQTDLYSIDINKVVDVAVYIKNDVNNLYNKLNHEDADITINISSGNIDIDILNGSQLDRDNYSNTDIDRGWLVVTYTS